MNLQDPKTEGWTDTGLKDAYHGPKTSYHGHNEGDITSNGGADMTVNNKSQTPEYTSATQQSANRLQTIYQQSLAFLASILREPQLAMLLTSWQKTLTPRAKNQILSLVKSANGSSGSSNISANA